MDGLGPLLGPGAGAALVSCLWALATAIKRRSEASAVMVEAEAKTEAASAGAVMGLLDQLHLLRKDLDRETAARVALQGRVDQLDDELAEAKSRAQHLESQMGIMAVERDQAVQWAKHLAEELAELRRQIQGSHTIPSTVPRK